MSRQQETFKLRVISWVQAEDSAEKRLILLADCVQQLYEETSEYLKDDDRVKGYIVHGLPPDEQEL